MFLSRVMFNQLTELQSIVRSEEIGEQKSGNESSFAM
jgi:hypothetical protein